MHAPTDGVFAALWTPTDAAGRLLEPELKDNLRFLEASGVHGLMVLGSTGEFPLLEMATRRRLLEQVRSTVPSLPVIANISHVRPAAVAELGDAARALGCAAAAVLAPWFFALPQEDLAEFFVRAGEAAGLPLFLYNFPERTGHRLALETIAAVADRVPVAGVKQSGAEFAYHRDLVALGRAKNFVVFTGGEPRLAEAMGLGVRGCVSGLANAVPEWVLALYEAARRGASEAATATEPLRQLAGLLAGLSFPLDVAAIMEARGRAVGEPKAVLSAATRRRYAELVVRLRDFLRAGPTPLL